MHIKKAVQLARYHKFNRLELYNILVDALEFEPATFWVKPNGVNGIFDNGYYFNRCREWVGYEKGVNDLSFPNEMVVTRVLQTFGKYSNIQVPGKTKVKTDIQVSEIPTL